jgi:hypothetical protein
MGAWSYHHELEWCTVRLPRWIRQGFNMASHMMNMGLDTYTIWAFQTDEDMEEHKWFFKDIFRDYDTACDFLEELRVLHDDLYFDTDFESLV